MSATSYREMYGRPDAADHTLSALEETFRDEAECLLGLEGIVHKLNASQKDSLKTILHELGPCAKAFVRWIVQNWHHVARRVEGLPVQAPRTPSLVFCARHLDELARLAEERGAFVGVDVSVWNRDPKPTDHESIRI